MSGAGPPDSAGWERVGPDQLVYDGYTRVVRRRLRRPDGVESDWDIVDCVDSVAVLARTPGGEIVCIRQFRPGPDRRVLSLPGGLLDPGESVEEAARRELREETGYDAERVEVVAHTAPFKSTERRWSAVAHDCVLVSQQSLDADEEIEVVLLGLDAVRAELRSGRLGTTDQAYLALDHLGLL